MFTRCLFELPAHKTCHILVPLWNTMILILLPLSLWLNVVLRSLLSLKQWGVLAKVCILQGHIIVNCIQVLFKWRQNYQKKKKKSLENFCLRISCWNSPGVRHFQMAHNLELATHYSVILQPSEDGMLHFCKECVMVQCFN